MARYNRFGATYDQVTALFPGTVVTDYDAGGVSGQNNIEGVMDRITREVAAALTPECYKQMTEVDAQLVVRYATSGQASFTPGITPLIAGTMHLWRYPSLVAVMPGVPSGLGGPSTLGDWAYRKPTVGFNEVPAVNYVPAGQVVNFVGITLTVGERVFASYDVDVDNAGFSMPSLADIVLLGAAAELGKRLYADGSQEWTLVEEYKARYRGAYVASEGGVIAKAFAGNWIPDELRKLTYWENVERVSPEVSSVRIYRG